MNRKQIEEFMAKKYFFINIYKLIMRKILTYSVKFIFQVDLISLKTIKEKLILSQKKIFIFLRLVNHWIISIQRIN